MKKGLYFVVLFFFLFVLCSCQPEQEKRGIKFTNLEEVGENLYQTYVDGSSVDISNYISCTHPYSIVCNNETYSSDNQTVFELSSTLTTFLVKFDGTTYQIKVYQNIKAKVTFVLNETFVLEKDILVGTLISNEVITEITSLLGDLGYTFNGEVSYNIEGKEFNNISLSNLEVTNDLVLKVCVTPNENVITVDGKEIIIKTGEVINVNHPSKEGYTFVGYQNGFENGALYATKMGKVFTSIFVANEYTLTLKYLDIQKTIKVKYDSSLLLEDLEIEGYTFNGWLYNGELVKVDFYQYPSDVTFTADLVPNTYKLKFTNIDEPFEMLIKYNEDFTLPAPKRENEVFLYFEYNGQEFTEGKWTYLHDVEVSAVWSKVQEDIELNLETFGGEVNTLTSVDSLGNIVLPTPTKEGYQFVGWYYDNGLTNLVTTIKASDYNQEVLYARYKYDSIDLVGEEIITKKNQHASDYTKLVVFDSTKSGFTSKYWHKVALVKTEKGYVVSAIATSGESISSLGEYDLVILAYSAYSNYNSFVNLGYKIGYNAIFTVDPLLVNDGDATIQVSFVAPNVNDDIDEIKAELELLYEDVDNVSSDIDLVVSAYGYALTWKSSNIKAISPSGEYTKPSVTRNVTLSAYVGETEVYSFNVTVKGDKDTSDALATGYIYTPYTITQNAMDMLDILYAAFLEIDSEGNWTNLSRMKSNLTNYVLPKSKISGTKVVISVNQKSSGNFSNVAKDATLRTKLADNIVAFILEMGLDGVDIDWETPSQSEAENFTLLMKEIYTKVKAVDENLLVTAAIGGGKWAPPKYDLPNSKNYMDYINLMTYSMAKSNGYYQNSLYKSTKGATLVSCSIDESIEIYNELGVENSQILVGIPFYCTKQIESGGPGSKTGEGKSVSYSVMLDEYPLSDTMNEYFDEECGVPYRYDPTTKIMFSYDNERSIKLKCDYINTLGLAGIMYWQYGQDVDDMLTNAIKKYINE